MAQGICKSSYALLLLAWSLGPLGTKADALCSYAELCSDHESVTYTYLETSCNTTSYTANVSNPGSGSQLQALDLVCETSNGTIRVDLLCDPSKYLRFITNADFGQLTIDNSREKISQGDVCYIQGCYNTITTDILTAFTSDNCIIPKTCSTSSPCHGSAVCTDTPQGAICTCKEGYFGNGTHCIETCSTTNPCDESAECSDTPQGTICMCTGGLFGNGTHCIETCSTTNPCDESAECSDTPQGTICMCKEGLSGNGTHCIGTCNTTNPCDESAECSDTPQGINCTCEEGYFGNGTHCIDMCKRNPSSCWECQKSGNCSCDDSCHYLVVWLVAVSVVLLSLSVGFCCISCSCYYCLKRKKRGLDHKRLEKFMGTFDPNFNPHISTNLTKVIAMSEASVFDNLWYAPQPADTDNDYITLQELGIHIHGNVHAKDSDSEGSIELGIDYFEENDQESDSPVTINHGREDDYTHAHQSENFEGDDDLHINLDAKSNYSLDFATVQNIFQTGRSFQMERESSQGGESELVDLDQPDFYGDLLQINIDDLSSDGEDADQPYIRVDDVCFTLPSNENIDEYKEQWMERNSSQNCIPLLATSTSENELSASHKKTPLSSHLSNSAPFLS